MTHDILRYINIPSYLLTYLYIPLIILNNSIISPRYRLYLSVERFKILNRSPCGERSTTIRCIHHNKNAFRMWTSASITDA